MMPWTSHLLRRWGGFDVERIVGLLLLSGFSPLRVRTKTSQGSKRSWTTWKPKIGPWRFHALHYPRQLLLIHFCVTWPGVFGLLLGKNGSGLLILRFALWWRLIDPGIQIQTAYINMLILLFKKREWFAVRWNQIILTYPSGTGTFFWALGATGLSSPANRAMTSSATSTSFCCSFWMYFTSCRMQEAWEQNTEKTGSWQVSKGILYTS